MTDTDKIFAGSIPEVYGAYLVPIFFEPYAMDLAQRVAALSPMSVLETAAGTGVVTRALAPVLDRRARYAVTDLSQPMLDRARPQQEGDMRLEWRAADALALPYGDRSFDAVLCAFGVMFFPDRVAGYREARRVLKPGGRFLFNVWDALEDNDFMGIAAKAAADAFPGNPPGFLARTPYGYHDTAKIEADLHGAGFADVTTTVVALPSEAPSPRHPAIGVCQGTPLRAEIEARDPHALERVTDLATEAIARKFGRGPVSGKMQAKVVVARA